jgi:hypothetical protein
MRTRRILGSAVVLSAALIGCEDGPSLTGPDQVFDGHDEVSDAKNGISGTDPWSVDEPHGFDSESSGDSVGRARFCDQAEADAQVQEMIKAPIKPDASLGQIPLWGADFTPLLADELLGKPGDNKFCDPSGVYSNAYTFGPLNEIVVIFNEETRLIEYMYAQKGYLGALEGMAQNAAGTEEKVWIRAGDPVRLGAVELRDDAPGSATNWMNPANINQMYRMVRKAFFPAAPVPAVDYDCIESRICRILNIGTSNALRLEDSGVVLGFPPQGGAVEFIMVQPVRVAPFEAEMNLDFGAAALPDPVVEEPPVDEPPVDEPPVEEPVDPAPPAPAAALAPVFTSGQFENCALKLDGTTTWKSFKQGCIKAADTLNRASFDVFTGRNGVRVDFNGVFLTFLHNGEPLKDGAQPADDDVLTGVSFTDNLNGPFKQWVPSSLGAQYKARLEATVRNSLLASFPDHPFGETFNLGTLPAFDTSPTSLSPITGVVLGDHDDDPNTPEQPVAPFDLVNDYVSIVQQAYASLTPEQAAYVDPELPKKTFLVAPFVQAALAVLTGGASDALDSVLTTVPTDDSLYVIGRTNFKVGETPYRVFGQYNFVFGGLVYVGIERDFSAVDEPINVANDISGLLLGVPSSYYEHYLGTIPGIEQFNPFALNSASIKVTGVDRQLNMMSVEVAGTEFAGLGPTGQPNLVPKTFKLKVNGAHLDDGAGFRRQLEGETFEFIRSHTLNFYGRETSLTVNVDANGIVQQTTQYTFKGPVFLCGWNDDGSPRQPYIFYGDDVRAKLDAFSRQDPQGYRNCGIVFNYSPNGNVLNTVASVLNKTSITVSGGRAVTVSAWQ